MKTIKILLFLLFPVLSYSQLYNDDIFSSYKTNHESDKSIILNENNSIKTYSLSINTNTGNKGMGVGMLLGGTALMTAGILTQTFTDPGKNNEPLPFTQQAGKYLAIGSGGIIFTVGLILVL